jgi:thiosulfate/3-mercaptopyruvate sulfurtransferase
MKMLAGKTLFYVLVALIFVLPQQVVALQVPGPLVETSWLAQYANKVVILDVRSDTKSFTAKPVFIKDKKTGQPQLRKVAGHIPGAIMVPYKKLRATRIVDGRKVQKMAPEKADFEKLMQQSGVNKGSAVVVVSKGQSSGDVTSATRLYWQLKYFGHDNVAILNGGTAQWLVDGRKVSSAPARVTTGNWQVREERKAVLASSEDVARAIKAGNAQVVDTRSVGQYLGMWKKSYVYDKGHIPGAKLFPDELISSKSMPSRFLVPEESRQLAKALNIDANAETITYCNSGHLASGSWFIISELLGNKQVKMYDGSMHQWTLEKRPVKAMVVE